MRLRRQASRPQHETIVTLIDVVFFLLVFFMLVGRFDASSPFELSPPISVSGQSLPAGGANVAVSHDGRLALDGSELRLDGIASRLRARAGETDTSLFIRINAHAGTPLRYLLQLMDELEGLGSVEIVLVVTPGDA